MQNIFTTLEATARANLMGTGISLIAVVGLIHLISAPEYFEFATYLGLLFVANFVGAAVAAIGIYRSAWWGWPLGALVAGGAFSPYILSRTVGLPGLPENEREWLDPLGILSLLVEGFFVGLYVALFIRRRTPMEPS